jgi:hypothetical protein
MTGWSSDRAADLALLQRGLLVPDNPLATADQRDLEALAIRLFETPELAAARARTALLWLGRLAHRPSGEAMRSFDDAVAEFVFHCCLNAANSDAGNPRVLKVEGEPHRWFGMDVPGARRGGNNADNAYRIIPVDGAGRFEIVGQTGANPPADVTTTLIANTAMSKTVHTIEWRDIARDGDGLFRITVDPDSADGRPNHFRSTPDARYLFIRDTLTDWTVQRVNRMAARRLDPAPEPLEFAELVRRAAQYADDDMAYYWDMCMGQSYGFPVNVVPPVRNAGAFGGLVSQSGSTGHFNVADDEALVITVTQGAARYMSFMAHDPWWRTLDFAPRTASLNNAQIARDADGAITFVVAPVDPGVHNWIDTGGLHEGIFYFRWQGLPADDRDPPVVRGYGLVKRSGLADALPPGTRFVTPEERAVLQHARAAAVAGWWRDA